MSAQTKFLLAVFYLCAFMALFAPMVLAQNGTDTPTNVTTTAAVTKYVTFVVEISRGQAANYPI